MADNPLAQAIQGDSSGLAPQQAPSAGGGAGGTGNPQADQLLQQLMQQAARNKTQLAQPQVSPKAGKIGGGAIAGGLLLNMFVPGVGTALMSHIKQSKETQVAGAVNAWRTLANGFEMADLMSQGDEKKRTQLFQQMPGVQAILSDKKTFKQMAKVFAEPWLADKEGKGNSVYHEGLMRFMKLHQAEEQIKKLKAHMGGQQQPQGQPQAQGQAQQQPAQMQQNTPEERAARLPVTMQPGDATKTAELGRTIADLDKAQASMREKYEFRPDAKGNIVAINKSDPRDTINVTDESGKQLGSLGKGKNGPMLVDGVPVGIFRNGKALTPQNPEWTAQDQADFKGYQAAYATSEQNKQRNIERAAQVRSEAYQKLKLYPVMNKDGQIGYVDFDMWKQNPDQFAPPSQGVKAMQANALFGSIDTSFKFLNSTIDAMGDDGFTPEARAQISAVMRDTAPKSALQSFFQSSAGNTLSPAQADYVIALADMAESAMSMRSIQGLGSSSDQLRGAIFKMLPGPNTPTKDYAKKQMVRFGAELEALRKGIPSIGLGGNSGGAKSTGGSSGGGVERPVYDKNHKLLGYTKDGKHFSRRAQ